MSINMLTDLNCILNVFLFTREKWDLMHFSVIEHDRSRSVIIKLLPTTSATIIHNMQSKRSGITHRYMKGATVAVLGWLCCCCWGSCTVPLPPKAPPPPSPDVADPESAEVLVDDTMLVFRFSNPPRDLCIYID